MKNIFASLVLTLISLSIAAPAMCAVKTATFQTTFTILETCRVDGAAAKAAPVVSCQMASSSFVAAPAQSQTGPAADGSPAWVVTF